MKKIYAYLLTAFVLVSCSESNDEDLGTSFGYELMIADSLDLRILGSPTLASVSEDGNKLVFYDYSNKEFVFTDDSGEVLSKFSKKGDTPDSYGFLMEFPGFIADDQVAVTGMKGIFVYDLNGGLVKKFSHPELMGGAAFMSFPGKGIESTTIDGSVYLLSKSVRIRDTYAGEQEFYDKFKAIELVDLEIGSFTDIVPFERGSKFLDGNGYYESDYAPAFKAYNGKLYVVLGGEAKLNVYALSPEGVSLDTIVELQIPDFGDLPITSRDVFTQGSVAVKANTPAIRNIHVLDEKLVIHYFGGIEEEKLKDANALWEAGDKEGFEIQYKKVLEQVVQGVLILDAKRLNVFDNLKLPEGVNLRGFASGGGFLWMERTPDPDDEEEFLRIYKVKITAQ
ncbi:hypothetical protein MM239_06310 [Belliella sp. DSM 111904]|uniref:Uncharacterized protein n=1 Tax=Belliella filtrata TaxID=2923435 RepID=A0ABS9UYH6_9BACT|nr:hypothetical protein [Belliella filtrata]MCH7408999.1 hypothetical protein [Belliella filtrata]